ncbi:MAG: hypothetical protein HOQ36_04150 [Nocardia sp.]|nr:hypothetical protein [Nocardia sp.]
MLALEILVWGLVAGLLNIVAMAAVYGNPWVARVHAEQRRTGGADGGGRSGTRGPAQHFLGDQIEVYAMTVGYAWLHPLLPSSGPEGALGLAALFAALRICAPVWALWMQGTYSRRYLAVEVGAGVVSTLVVTFTLYLLM